MFAEISVTDVMKYLTPETVTIFMVVIGLFLGFKVARYLWSTVFGFLAKFSFASLAASVLVLFGLSSGGAGTAELISRMVDGSPKEKTEVIVGMSDSNLVKMAETAKDKEVAATLINYAQQRDKANTKNVSEMERLIDMAANAKPENKELILNLIKLQQTKEEQKGSLANYTSPISVENSAPLTVNIPAETVPQKSALLASSQPRSNSYLSLHAAIIALAIGIGSVIFGINVYNNRPSVSQNHTSGYR